MSPVSTRPLPRHFGTRIAAAPFGFMAFSYPSRTDCGMYSTTRDHHTARSTSHTTPSPRSLPSTGSGLSSCAFARAAALSSRGARSSRRQVAGKHLSVGDVLKGISTDYSGGQSAGTWLRAIGATRRHRAPSGHGRVAGMRGGGTTTTPCGTSNCTIPAIGRSCFWKGLCRRSDGDIVHVVKFGGPWRGRGELRCGPWVACTEL